MAVRAGAGDARARARPRPYPARGPGARVRPAGAASYRLSDAQAQAILELRLQRLTGLEQDKIRDEYREVMTQIADLLDILDKPARITAIIGGRAEGHQGSVRRRAAQRDRHRRGGHLARGPDRAAGHGGDVLAHAATSRRSRWPITARSVAAVAARSATATKEDDFIERLFVAHSHDYLLCFSSRGRLYWLKVYRGAAGQPQQPRQADRQRVPAR